MATQESIHQGWLYARDGKKFAPITLIDDVYAMNGKKYKDVVTQQINNITTAQNTSLTSINQTLGQHTTDIEALENADKEILAKLTNFGDDGTDALYIVDKSNNVIAYINGLGVHSVDFTLPNENQFSLKDFINNKYASFVTSTNTTLSTLTKKLANFGDDGDNTSFYIVDQYNNVIAYFDETGANSINFTTPSGNLNQVISDLSQEIKDRTKLETVTVAANTTAINSIKKDIQYFNAGDTDTELYIIDKNNNVMAYVDETGLHSLNVYSKNFDLEGTNTRVKVIEDETIPNAVSNLTTAYQTADNSIRGKVSSNTSQITDINNRLQYFNLDGDSTALYIIDKNNNVIAYFDEKGLTAHNVMFSNARNLVCYGNSPSVVTYNFTI